MTLVEINKNNIDKVASLIADFRVTLLKFKNIESSPDINSAFEEVNDFLDHKYPIFVVEGDNKSLGYIVCKIDGLCVWVEHIYVDPKYRRQGVASLLFKKAEEISESFGGDTVFNFVHPNNQVMIDFLRSKGYTVLNMIEIRKPYKGEKPSTTVQVDNNKFDY